MKKIITLVFVFLMNIAVANSEIWLFGTKNQIFTQQHRFVKNWEIKHYLIDKGRDFEAKISKGLSNHPEIALKQIKQRFNSNKKNWEIEAKQSWQAAVNAQTIGVVKVPAISFDKGRSLIYGVLDISLAYKRYLNFKK